MEEFKIVAVVKFNQLEAYVLNRLPEFKYKKIGSIMYGIDSGLFQCYSYESCDDRWKAFGGRKFDIKLENGEIEHCYGQWWNGGHDKIAKLENIELIGITFQTVENLKDCYVFTGGSIDKEFKSKLRAEYTGNIYEYREYEKIIKYDDEIHKWIHRHTVLERINRNIIKNARLKKKEILELKNQLSLYARELPI